MSARHSAILRGSILETTSSSTPVSRRWKIRCVARLHVLVHGDEALETGGLGFVLLLCRNGDAGFGCLELGELPLHAFSRRPLSGSHGCRVPSRVFEFLAALLQPFEDGAFGARGLLGPVGNDRALKNGRGGFAGSDFRRVCPRQRSRPAPNRRCRQLSYRLETTPRPGAVVAPLPSGKLNICDAHDSIGYHAGLRHVRGWARTTAAAFRSSACRRPQ